MGSVQKHIEQCLCGGEVDRISHRKLFPVSDISHVELRISGTNITIYKLLSVGIYFRLYHITDIITEIRAYAEISFEAELLTPVIAFILPKIITANIVSKCRHSHFILRVVRCLQFCINFSKLCIISVSINFRLSR